MTRIAVLQPAYLGDVVFASPLTRAIAKAWPGCEIAFVARPPADDLARCLPGVRTVLAYDKRGRDRGLRGIERLATELRRFAPEALVSFHGSLRTGLLAARSGIRRRIGPAGEPGSVFFHERVRLGASFPGRAVALARALALEADERLCLELPEDWRERGRELAGGGGPLALVPGSEWETKRWPIERAAAFAHALLRAGIEPILLGSPAERALCAEVARRAGPGCRDVSGNRVAESLGILASCRGAVGGDSGLVHAARALGIPTVMLFGPTDPARHAWREGDAQVTLGLSCSPCSDHGSRSCPLGHHRCLADLSPERVLGELSKLGVA